MEPRDGLTVLIPARGGSKQIPDKNLRLIRNLPLVIHVATTCRQLTPTVVVTTDSPRIAAVCRTHGIPTLDRPARLADDTTTVDDVVKYHLDNHHVDYPLLVVQPTVPEISASDLASFIDGIDAVGYRAAAMSTPTHHLLWQNDLPLQERHNRQTVKPVWQEIGVRYHRETSDPPTVVWHLDKPISDIDTLDDLHTARRRLEAGDIVFDYVADMEIGWGHLTRCHALAQELSHHIRGFGDSLNREQPPPSGKGVWVFDRLDTTIEQVAGAAASGWKTLTLEDRGPGARHADAIVNALYPIGHLPQEKAGSDWVVLKPEFHGLPVKDYRQSGKILVTFGGTDPACLTERVSALFPDVTVITPPGKGGAGVTSMAAELYESDLVITSAGRTLYEAAAVGTPAISIAANARETTHAHLGVGNLFLGHHAQVSDTMIRRAVWNLADDERLRRDIGMQGRRSIDGKGTARLVHLIEGLML